MSWIEQINSDFIITTGDGKEYRPNWLNATKQVEYNVSEFDFIDKGGTLVKRGKHRGSRYNLELYFQGDDHLDISRQFELSARNSKPWTILHPFYGNLLVHPTSLTFDNTNYNVTQIRGVVIETIGQVLPQTTVSIEDKVTSDKESLDEEVAQAFSDNVSPDTGDINTMTANNDDIYNVGAMSAKTNSQEYFNTYIEANSAVQNASSDPLQAMIKIQALINAPALFDDSVQNRMNILLDQFDSIRAKLANVLGVSDKRIYESTLGTIVTAMAEALITGTYSNKSEVITQVENLLNSYSQFLTDLDGLQTDTGGSIESYLPDVESMILMNNLINFVAANLFTVAISARTEYSVILEDDSDPVTLTHRFYGLDEGDENLVEFIESNNLSLSEYLIIPKGRSVVYYV